MRNNIPKAFRNEIFLKNWLREHPDREQYIDAYALATFARDARYIASYEAAADWTQVIKTSNCATPFLESNLTNRDSPDFCMALFGYLFHQEFLIDPVGTDLEGCRKLLTNDLLAGRARLPYSYGRLLYDKFNVMFPDGAITELLADDALELLSNTPQGVYQIGTLLTGPLGIIRSQTTRSLKPSASLILWHLRHRGTARPNVVRLNIHDTAIAANYRHIEAHFKSMGPRSEWDDAIDELCIPPLNSLDHLYRGMGPLIAECVVGDERTALLVSVLESAEGKVLRDILGQPPRKRSAGQGASTDVAAKLSPEEQLQLLLVLSDSQLAKAIDIACRRGAIQIEDHRELAEHNNCIYWDSAGLFEVSLGPLGVRNEGANPALRLSMTLAQAFNKVTSLDDLAWKVRSRSRTTLHADVIDYVKARGPLSATNTLALSSRSVFDAVLSSLGIPEEGADENSLVKNIVWKCGFDLPQSDPTWLRLEERMQTFKEAVASSAHVPTESARERLRSSGVNLFVSIEEFLESLVAYLTWLLTLDPYAAPALAYHHSWGLEAVAQIFPGRPDELSPDSAQWDEHGRNTLGTLLSYLQMMAKWISSLNNDSRSAHKRQYDELPEPHASTCGTEYAFSHRQLWANCEPDSFAVFQRRVADVASLIARSNVAGVRNALDHKRSADAFPGGDRLSGFIVQFENAMRLAELYRLIPKEHTVEVKQSDRYGHNTYVLVDSKGQKLELFDPCTCYGFRRSAVLQYKHSIIVAPEGILGGPRELLCLARLTKSPYSSFWANYPRTRELSRSDTMAATTPLDVMEAEFPPGNSVEATDLHNSPPPRTRDSDLPSA